MLASDAYDESDHIDLSANPSGFCVFTDSSGSGNVATTSAKLTLRGRR